jgi:hypothetical protein
MELPIDETCWIYNGMQKYMIFEHEIPEKSNRMQNYTTFAEIFIMGANVVQKCIPLNPDPIEAPLTEIRAKSAASDRTLIAQGNLGYLEKSGLRFSLNASRPSFASSVV